MNSGKICISICAKTAAELLEKIGRAEALADVIEIRFDCLAPAEVGYALENLPMISKRYLLTFRPSEQGGKRVLPLAQRIMFWKQAVRSVSGLDFLVDHEADLEFPLGFSTGRIIRSYHYFGDSPADLRGAFWELADLGDAVIKIAADCPDITDTVKVWKLLETAENNDDKVIPIAMGEPGKWTRILGPAFGAYLTYAALEAGGETAPGQISAHDMINVFRARELDRETQVYGIVAGDTTYSVSPWMHNAAFAATEMNRVFVPLQAADLDGFVRRMVRKDSREIDINFAGFSVTNPHKLSIMRHLDEIDESAARIGAVNTVRIDDGKLLGYNTDAPGFIGPLKEIYGDLKNARVAVAGAGGAARACIAALCHEKADVTVYARDMERGKRLSEEFSVDVGRLPDKNAPFEADILVNATPLGTKGETADKSIATQDQLRNVRLVYDLVYNPEETLLRREAKSAGIRSISGLEMLIAQGAKQFEIWTSETAPIEAMTNAVRTKLNERTV